MLVGVASLNPASSQATRHAATSQPRVFLRSQHILAHNLFFFLQNWIKNLTFGCVVHDLARG